MKVIHCIQTTYKEYYRLGGRRGRIIKIK
jgi:hypothetical protein